MSLVARAEPAVFRGAPQEIADAIRNASAESGVSFSYLMAQAAVESGFRADAKAPTSSATGLYQFIERTWLDMVREYGDKFGLGHYADALESGRVDRDLRREILDLRKDPKTAAQMAAQYACENQDRLERTVGGRIGDTELYLAHFLGPAGAARFLKAWRSDPGQAAAEVLPDAARANRSIFYDRKGTRSLDQVYRHFAAKFRDCDAPAAPTASSFALAAAAPSAKPAAPGQVPQGEWRAAQSPAARIKTAALSPTAYAAKIFMAALRAPGEEAPRAMPGAIAHRAS